MDGATGACLALASLLRSSLRRLTPPSRLAVVTSADESGGAEKAAKEAPAARASSRKRALLVLALCVVAVALALDWGSGWGSD